MSKHEIYVRDRKFEFDKDYVQEAISKGLKGMKVVEYEQCSMYAEAYRLLYNEALVEGRLDDADFYGRIMRTKLYELKTILER